RGGSGRKGAEHADEKRSDERQGEQGWPLAPSANRERFSPALFHASFLVVLFPLDAGARRRVSANCSMRSGKCRQRAAPSGGTKLILLNPLARQMSMTRNTFLILVRPPACT